MSLGQSFFTNNTNKTSKDRPKSDSRILKQREYLENELLHQEKVFLQRNNLDEKITNNMLKINVFLYFFTVAVNCFLIFFPKEIFSISPKNQSDKSQIIAFSLLDFTYKTIESVSLGSYYDHASNYYTCIKSSSNCELSDYNSCKNINLAKILKEFPLTCEEFEKFFIASIIVNLK